jgi:siroheme decarboxylase
VPSEMTDFQKQLCAALQDGLPLCRQPFAALAAQLGSDEPTVLRETAALKEIGVIRRLAPILDYRALGKVSTLVAAHVDPDDLPEVTIAVNSLLGVSHNYLRRHHYNLWFTLQGDSPAAVEAAVASLSDSLGVEFHSMPALRFFKLDVRFNASADVQGLAAAPTSIGNQPVTLLMHEKVVLDWLQDGIDITSEPFASGQHAVETLAGLIAKGVVKRIAATVDHRRLGFTANVMFCCKVAESAVDQAGRKLAASPLVSHCYERRTFDGWPWNLFAMMHGRSMGDIQNAIDAFASETGIEEFELLPTAEELKKKPVRHDFTA